MSSLLEILREHEKEIVAATGLSPDAITTDEVLQAFLRYADGPRGKGSRERATDEWANEVLSEFVLHGVVDDAVDVLGRLAGTAEHDGQLEWLGVRLLEDFLSWRSDDDLEVLKPVVRRSPPLNKALKSVWPDPETMSREKLEWLAQRQGIPE